MTDWQKCLTATDCFAMAYYNADGSLDGECQGELSPNADSLSLKCGEHQDAFIKDESGNLVSGKTKLAPPADGSGVAVLKISADTASVVKKTTQEEAGSSPVIVKIRTKKETIIKDFENFGAYTKWLEEAGIPKSEIIETDVRKVETSQGKAKNSELRFDSIQAMREFLANGEAFVFNKQVYTDREALRTAIAAVEGSTDISFLHLMGGARPTVVSGKAEDLLAYAENLVQEASGKTFGKARVVHELANGDIRVSIFGGGGYRTKATVKLEGEDAAAAAEDHRSTYGGIGIEVGGHYWYLTPKDWFSLGVGAQDAISFEFGPDSTADSAIFTNRFNVDPVSLRFTPRDWLEIVIDPLGFGCYTVDGISDTLGDTGRKQDTPPTTFGIYNPELSFNFFVTENIAITAYGGMNVPLNHPSPVTGYAGLGITIALGGTDEYNGVVELDEPYTPPAPQAGEVSTKINVPPKAIKPLEYRELPPTALVLPPLDTNAIFEPNKADLKTESIEGRQINRGVYDVVKAVEDYKARLNALGIGDDLAVELTLEAFADSQGSVVNPKDRTKGNQPLSEARIASFSGAVEAELKARNIVGVTIKSKGRGEEEPVLHACVMTTAKKPKCDVKASIKGPEVTIPDVPGLELLPEGFYDANGDRVPGYYYNGQGLCTPSPTKTCQSAVYGAIFYRRDLTEEEKARGVRAKSIPEVKYVENLQKSRRLKGTAVPTVSSLNITPNENAENLKGKAAFELQGVNIKAVSVPLVLTAPLPATMNEYFVANVIPNFAGIVQHLSREENRNEIILTVNIKDGKDVDTKCGYLSLIAGMFSNGKTVRVMVSTDPNYSDSVIVTAGENTNIIKPEVTTDDPEDSGIKLRKHWLDMIRGVKAE